MQCKQLEMFLVAVESDNYLRASLILANSYIVGTIRCVF